MASPETIGALLKGLAVTFPKDISRELVAVYVAALADVPDGDLKRAVDKAVRTCRFFPVPAELRDLAGANKPLVVDADGILSQVWTLADYHPSYGTRAPAVEAVRDVFGDAVADAYGMAGGGSRLYSSNETTAAIARRDFAQELQETAKREGLTALPEPRLALPSGIGGPVLFGDSHRGGGFKRLGGGTG